MSDSINRRRVTATDETRIRSSRTRRPKKHHASRRIPSKIRSKPSKILNRSFSEPNLNRSRYSEDDDHRRCSTPMIDLPTEESDQIVYLSKIRSEVFASAPSLSGFSSPSSSSSPINQQKDSVTSSDQHLSCLPRDPVPLTASGDRKQDYLADAWDLLKPAINIILDDSFSFKSSGGFCCNTIFRAVKRACFNDRRQVQRIFDLVKQECEPHVATTMLFLEKQSNDPSVFLPLVYNCWLGFKKKMMFVSDLAMYHKLNDMTLWDVGQEIFHKQLSMAPQLQDQVIAGMLGLITDERLGKTDCNTSLLKNLMDMFYGLSLNVFDKTFLDSTSKFYSKEAEQVLQQSDISQYLEYVEGSLREEEKKYDKHYVFFASCRIRLMKVLERQILANRAGVFEEGFKVLMDEGRTRMDDLRRMYRLFSRADMVVYIDRTLRSYILAKGDGARQEGSLHELHARIHKIWHGCFNKDDLLDKTIRECFDGLGLHVRRLNIRIKSSGKNFRIKSSWKRKIHDEGR